MDKKQSTLPILVARRKFLARVFTRKDLHVIMLALNISDTILQKNHDVFVGPFVKEGVLFAIDALIVPEKCSHLTSSMFNDFQLSNSKKYTGKESIRCLCYSFSNKSSTPESESKNCKLELESVQTLAKHIKTNYFDTNDSSTSETGITPILEKLKSLSSELCVTQEYDYDRVLHQIMSILNGKDVISTFEFVESGIADSLVDYLSSGGCSRLESFGKLFLSCTNQQPFDYFYSLSGFISKLQSALSSIEDFPVVINNAFKNRNSYANVPHRRSTTYPCLKVLFVKEEGELTLTDFSGDIQNVDPFSDFDAIETFLWPKVCSNDNKDIGSSAQSPSDKSQHDVGQTSAQKPSEDTIEHDSPSHKLSFYLEGKQVDRGLTIYQAILSQHIAVFDTVNGLLWNQLHKITYEKSPKLEKQEKRSSPKSTPLLSQTLFSKIGSSVEKSTPCHNILFLLRILESVNKFRFHLMSRERISAFSEGKIGNLDDLKATHEGIMGNQYNY